MLNHKAKILAIPIGAALVLGGAFLVTPAMAATLSASSVHPSTDEAAAALPIAVSSKYSADSAKVTLTPNTVEPVPVATTLPVAVQDAPEAPDVEAPEVETPKVEAPEAEAPKVEAPEAEAPKVEAPEVEAPKVEAPKVEAPKDQRPSASTSHSEATEVSQESASNSGD